MKRRDYMLLFAVIFILVLAVVTIYFKSNFTGNIITGGAVDESGNVSGSLESTSSLSNEDAQAIFDAERAALDTQISERIKLVAGEDLDNSTKEFVSKFVSQGGVQLNQINNITKVDLNALPKDVQIDNVKDANIAIYEVNYSTANFSEGQVYIVTYAVSSLKKLGDLILAQDKREILVFGSSAEMSGAGGFLSSAVGIKSSVSNGYVMARAGSITALSTNLNVISGVVNDSVEIIVYKNGEPISFGNSLEVSSAGGKIDYDVQSTGTIKFLPGDVISAYAKSSSDAAETKWSDVVTLVEITADE
ncbi:MAG: hypothetical protein Q7S56_02780 [Nanoarchaeota archaeon]|nr:hypothetical protein [Nanoarchaeota archaeon]